ncbi:hypothetical protein BKA69DRAFT_1170726 [Paraphysoderma sedebokerense]|nr:hypothetical protein BKA69DRAFT_1170726 [Paraphysoderma sedebokerense]
MISNHLKQLAQLTLKSRPLRITNVSHRIGRHPVCKSATNNATAYRYRPSVNQSYRKMMSDPGTVRSFTMTTPVSRILDATFPLFTKPLDRIASLETLSSKYSQWFERYIRIRNHSVSNYIPDLSCGKLTESLLIPKRNGPVGWIARKLKMFWLILTPAQKRVFICSRCSPTPMNPKFIILGKVMEYRTTDTSANNSRTEPLHFEASYLIVDDVSSAQILKSVSAVIASPSMSQQKPAIGNSKNSYSSYWQLMINRLSAFQKAVVRSTTAFLAIWIVDADQHNPQKYVLLYSEIGNTATMAYCYKTFYSLFNHINSVW